MLGSWSLTLSARCLKERPRVGGAVSGPPSLLGKAGLPAWGLALNVGSTGSESVSYHLFQGKWSQLQANNAAPASVNRT
jgi:hypothetical protein